MIPTSNQLEHIAHQREGNLRETPFAVVLHALAVHRRTVVLEIERKPLSKSIILEDGVPVDCRSNLLHETLGRFMVARGDLSEDQYQSCLKRSIAEERQLGEVLIEDGRLDATELYKVLQLNLAKKLLDVFSWRDGSYRLVYDVPSVDSPLKVKAPQLVVMGISKFARLEEVNQAVGPLVGQKLFLHPEPPFPLGEIRLAPKQQQLVSLLAQGKRMDELAAETTIPFDEITRLLYSLAVIGIVAPEDRMPKLPPKPVRTPPPAPAPAPPPAPAAAPVRPSVDTAELERRRNALMAIYLRYRKQDSFDLLEVPEIAPIEEIQRRFLGFARQVAPWSFDQPGFEATAEKAEEVFLAAARAFGELADLERRNALIHRRKVQREERQKKKSTTDRFAIKSDLLDTELQFKRGQSLMAAGKFGEAVQLLEFAYDCDPQNANYLAELAYCRFLEKPDRLGPDSLRDLEEARRHDPRCGLAYFYAGEISAELGRKEDAERFLQQSIKLLPGDRRPIESLKVLQTKKKGRW